MDPFVILPQERARYIEQFNSLKPVNGFISGDQAKGFLLQSQLPPMILGHIWELADLNSDGKLDFTEFSIACKLINAKLRGFDIPKILPPTLRSSAVASGLPAPSVGTPGNLIGAPLIPSATVSTMPAMMSQQVVMQPVSQPLMASSVPQNVPIGMMHQSVPMVPTNLPLLVQNTMQAPMQVPIPSQVQMPIQAPVIGMTSPPGGFPASAGSLDLSKPNTPDSNKTAVRAPSIASGSPSTEWAIPHSSKLKYTQLFNTHDRGKTGFLTGVQARGILVQTQLPQAILARIWGLSDIDADGRLSCDEFVLAMHFCDVVRAGEKLPDALPSELIPPTFRRPSLASVGATSVLSPGGASNADVLGAITTSPPPSEDMKITSPVSFEDKRKENFDKGQAELDKRRRALAEQQRREQEERERKEREENERKEKIRLEQERRIQAEMEKKLAKQREIEMEKEEQRRKMLEQREAARKEMERQRQLEWQKQRLQELQQQKQKEQERVALLRANHHRLETELNLLDERVMTLSSKIMETRTGVAETKNTIDGMRTTRDTQMAQMAALKTQLREQNQRLLLVSQEKARLEAKNRMNAATSPSTAEPNAAQNIAARQLALNQQKEKLELLTEELNKKLQDAENNNAQLNTLKTEMSTLAHQCTQSHQSYLKKREEVLLLRATGGKPKPWSGDDAWSGSSNSWGSTPPVAATAVDLKAGQTRYRALYEFVARNGDEISFQPGDIIMVTESLSNEPGWLSGEVRGHVGWFPEAYVEKMDQSSGTDPPGVSTGSNVVDAVRHQLEGIQELPENVSDNGSIADPAVSDAANSAFIPVSNKFSADEASSPVLGQGELVDDLKVEAAYDWDGKKENHLSFRKGEVITVRERQEHWWFGHCNGVTGWFPQSFVTLIQADVPAPSTVPDNNEAIYVAVYPYESNEPGDLSFLAGEIITVVKKDGDWWTGVIGRDRTGVFPSNYVQRASEVQQCEATAADSEVEAASAAADAAAASAAAAVSAAATANKSNDSGDPTSTLANKRPNTAPLDGNTEMSPANIPRAASAASSGATSPANAGRGSKKPEIATVIAPYTATSSEQLSLTRGQLIMIRKKSASGWWEGELQAKGRKRQIGWFPASYVKVLSSSGGSSRTTPVPAEMEDDVPHLPQAAPTETEIKAAFDNKSTPAADQVVALFPYTAQNEDELSFLQGDVLVVVDREDPAWWRGQLRGQEGLFPSNYVEVMGSLAASAALGAAASSSPLTQ